jgi:hypothetical protein
VEARWFGMPPPFLLLGLATALFAAAIALLAAAQWPFGLFLLGIAALIGAVFAETARRAPPGTILAAFLDRARTTAATQRVLAARSVLATERRQALLRLGEALHREDETAAADVRDRIAELDRADEELAGRLRSVKLATDETMIQIPEPYPPPDEGTPPTPAPVPEPSPDSTPDEDADRPAA